MAAKKAAKGRAAAKRAKTAKAGRTAKPAKVAKPAKAAKAAKAARAAPVKRTAKRAPARVRAALGPGQKITPFLWFDGQAEEAARFYTSLFPDSAVTGVSRYAEGGPAPAGSVMSASFRLAGLEFIALNGGPHYSFTPAVSFFIHCADQREVDHYWDRLLEGGQAQQCGWVTDRFGLTWQVVPDALGRMLGDKDPRRAGRVMQAMMGMVKLDVAALQAAYDGR